MTEDIVCVDGEIKTVSKEIEAYLESMIYDITAYNRYLKQVQRFGIQDELIRAKIGNLYTLLASYRVKMAEILEAYQKDEKGFLKDFEKKDVFKFPYESIMDIEAMLNIFD